MNNTISYKKFFIITSIIICFVMALAVIITAIFINQMREYTDYLSSYFTQEREEGFLIAHDVVINRPISEGEEKAFNTALILMPIIGTILTVGISALYMVCFTKEKDTFQRQRITHHYLTFINVGLAFIIMSFLEYSFGKNVVFAGDTAFGRAFSGLIRWSITYFGIRFIFMIAQIITERKTMKKREMLVRGIYSVASLTVCIFYLLLAVKYQPKTDTAYTTILGFIVVPICIVIFETILLYFKILDRRGDRE